MLSAGQWKLSQQNQILFVLIDSNGAEVSGLGTSWTLEISKAGAAFVVSAGAKAEIGNGWYSYVATAGEADTVGGVAIQITHGSIIPQNIEYVVETRVPNAVEFTYTVTDVFTSDPIDAVYVLIATDVNISNIVWAGHTDSFGVARDIDGGLPWLAPGTYFIRLLRAGYIFEDDQEIVS